MTKKHSYMDEDGNLVGAPPGANDFGKGFRKWASTGLESSDNPNSFLSRASIQKFLKMKKEGKINTGFQHSSNNDGKSKDDMDMTDPRKTKSLPGRSSTYNGKSSHMPEGGHEHHHAPPRRKKSFKEQRKDPSVEKFKKKLYKIGMEPHEAADGIMK